MICTITDIILSFYSMLIMFGIAGLAFRFLYPVIDRVTEKIFGGNK